MPVVDFYINKDNGEGRIKALYNCVFFDSLYIVCLLSVSVTFHNNETTWIGAVQYCKSIGAVLYSDEKDIRNRTDYIVWTGKYKILTPWAITLGCYEIDPKKVFDKMFEVALGNQAECQKICMGTDYFAIELVSLIESIDYGEDATFK
ncbi:Hypothetical predicted protein [Mytilus galloprovincialis]|uniref:Uncharacterized protein n=1 Tax=Mytilus galloprovincialis TaxID=29158 RepID=A0A8B6BNQ6_MYTGA|nr:Hypothetical predicted protein [Mytilus galloprovincialis]